MRSIEDFDFLDSPIFLHFPNNGRLEDGLGSDGSEKWKLIVDGGCECMFYGYFVDYLVVTTCSYTFLLHIFEAKIYKIRLLVIGLPGWFFAPSPTNPQPMFSHNDKIYLVENKRGYRFGYS